MSKSVWKKGLRFVLLCTVSSVLLAGCLGEDKPSPQPSGEVTPVATAMMGDDVVATPTVEVADVVPLMSLAANNARDTEVMQGWPIMFEVSLTHPDFMLDDVIAEPVVVGTDSKPWTGAVKLEIVDSEGTNQIWPLKLAAEPTGSVTLDAASFGDAYWTLGIEETAKLKEGTYVVTATLDTTSMENGGVGIIESIPAMLTVTKAPATLSDDQQSGLAQSLAAQAVVAGDSKEAMSILEERLAKKPGDISVLEFKGDLLAADGKTKEALSAYNAALKSFYEANTDAPESPSVLTEKQHEMMDKLLATP